MSGKWMELCVTTTTEAVEAISNIFIENGAQGVAIEDPKDFFFQKANEYDWDYVDEEVFNMDDENVYVKAYLSQSDKVNNIIENIEAQVKELSGFGLDIGVGELNISYIDEEDWSNNWKEYYKPFKIGDKIVIKPEWEDYEQEDGDLIIEMNPGMAFGTGDHETTSMCIENLEKYVKPDSIVYDIGCGSGILGIVAAKLGAKSVVGIDIDENAVRVANENVLKNCVEDIMSVHAGNLADDLLDSEKPDIVVANIIADIIMILSKDVKNILKDGGIFISSGIILSKIDEVVSNLESIGFEVLDVRKKGEWSCIIAR